MSILSANGESHRNISHVDDYATAIGVWKSEAVMASSLNKRPRGSPTGITRVQLAKKPA